MRVFGIYRNLSLQDNPPAAVPLAHCRANPGQNNPPARTVSVMMAVPAPARTCGSRAWQILAWLCCALMLGPGAAPLDGCCRGLAPAPLCENESESSTPVSSDEDDTESGTIQSGQSLRGHRDQRRASQVAVSVNWLVHLPHHHTGQPGYALPVCTPFEHGLNPPLRC